MLLKKTSDFLTRSVMSSADSWNSFLEVIPFSWILLFILSIPKLIYIQIVNKDYFYIF